MRRLFHLLLVAAAVFCSCSKTLTNNLPTTDVDQNIYVGICPSGIGNTALGYYRSIIKSVGGTLSVNADYCWTQEAAQTYVSKVDAIIAPGSTSGDHDDRGTSDNLIIKAAISAGKPVLGICYGHQRLNMVLGGANKKIEVLAPESTVVHKRMNGSTNVGIRSEIHSITIDTTSVLYSLLGASEVKVNSSHVYAIGTLSSKLKVVARSEDGIIEAVEGDKVMGVQFHPEYLCGEMNKMQFKPIFQHLVDMAGEVKFGK